MLDGVGPGSYADREDIPELTMDDIPCIVPMRLAEGFVSAKRAIPIRAA